MGHCKGKMESMLGTVPDAQEMKNLGYQQSKGARLEMSVPMGTADPAPLASCSLR